MSIWTTLPIILERSVEVIKAVAGLRGDNKPRDTITDATAAREGAEVGAAAHRASRQRIVSTYPFTGNAAVLPAENGTIRCRWKELDQHDDWATLDWWPGEGWRFRRWGNWDPSWPDAISTASLSRHFTHWIRVS